jgi:hypothetical protein
VASLEFFSKEVLGTITLNPHTFANEIKRHPEVETLLVTILEGQCSFMITGLLRLYYRSAGMLESAP